MPTIFDEVRTRYPLYADLTDEELYADLINPAKFRRAFPEPEFANLSDADILRNVQKFAPKGFAEQHPILETAAKAAAPLYKAGVELFTPLWQAGPPARELGERIAESPIRRSAVALEQLKKGERVSIPPALETPMGQFTAGAMEDVGEKILTPLTAPGNLALLAAGAAAPAAVSRTIMGGLGALQALEAVKAARAGDPQQAAIGAGMSLLATTGALAPKGASLPARWREYYQRAGFDLTTAQRMAELQAARGAEPPAAPIAPPPATAPQVPRMPGPPVPQPTAREQMPQPTPGERPPVPPTPPTLTAIERTRPGTLTVMPRPGDLKPLTQEYFGSPSVQWSKVSPTAGQIPKITIRATQNIARNVANAMEEFHSAWRPLKDAEQQAVMRALDTGQVPPNFTAKQTHAYNWTREYLTDQLQRINAARERTNIEANLQPGDVGYLEPIQGIENYWPHTFRGDWSITKRVGADWVPIETGWLAETKPEAITRAKEYLVQHPGARLKVQLKQLHIDPQEATALSRKGFWRLVNRLQREETVELDPLSGEAMQVPLGRERALEMMQGVARIRRPVPSPQAGFLMPRRQNLPGWLETPDALGFLIRGAERYIEMLPARRQISRLRERLAEEGFPEDSRLAKQVDAYIDAAVKGRPDDVTNSVNSMLLEFAEKYNVPMKPAAVQRLSGTLTSLQSFAKLGFSPVSAIVNFTQTPLNVLPVLGMKWTMRGIHDYMQYAVKGRHKNVIDELGIRQQASKVEEARIADYVKANLPRHARELPGAVARSLVDTSLAMFRMAEGANRGITALGEYARARNAGLSHAAAIESARELITRTQFVYGVADAPAVLRPAWARAPLQFKTFMLKELEFMLNLKPNEHAVFWPVLTALAGSVGLPGVMLIDEIAELITKKSPLRELGISAREAPGAKGALERAIYGGLPAAVGVDITRNVGFSEYLSPTQLTWTNLLGPSGSDAARFIQYIAANPGRDRQQALRSLWAGLSPSMRRAIAVLAPNWPQSRQEFEEKWKRGEFQMIDPRTQQTVIEDLSLAEAISMLFGFTPNSVALEREKLTQFFNALYRDQSLRGGYIDAVAFKMNAIREALAAGNTEYAERLRSELRAITMEAREAGYAEDLMSAGRARAEQLRMQRLEYLRRRRAPRRLRRRLATESKPQEQ